MQRGSKGPRGVRRSGIPDAAATGRSAGVSAPDPALPWLVGRGRRRDHRQPGAGRRGGAGRLDGRARRHRPVRGPVQPDHLAVQHRAEPRPHACQPGGAARSGCPTWRTAESWGNVRCRCPLSSRTGTGWRRRGYGTRSVPERIVGGRQLWDHVQEAIEHLPAAQRAVLILRDIEERAAEEACVLLNISAENQRVLLHRARGRIRATVDTLIGAAPAAAARAAPARRGSGATERAARFVAAASRLLAFGRSTRIGRWIGVWTADAA